MKLGLMLGYSGSKASVPTELVVAAESWVTLLFGQLKLGVLMLSLRPLGSWQKPKL